MEAKDPQTPARDHFKIEGLQAIVRPVIALGGFAVLTFLVLWSAILPGNTPDWVFDLVDEWTSLVVGAIFFYLGSRSGGR